MSYQTINPFDGKTLKSFEHLANTQVEERLASAAICFAAIIARAGALLTRNTEVLARTMTLEMGKRLSEARGEVAFSARILAYYAANAERFLAPVKLNPTHGEAHLESTPLGVIFCVQPWNFPFYQLARIAGPHLMAGNVLMVKHASIVPQCALAFEALWAEAGAPAGLYTNLFITHDQSERLIADPRIKGVALTGSVDAARRIAASAGQHLKVSSMELGGSDAFIVLDDADLELAVKWAVWGRFYNNGQTCCGAKRFIVAEKVADAFSEKFHAALSALKAGDPMDEKTTFGPLSSESALTDLVKQVELAVAHGARLSMGGKRMNRPGWFMQPTVLTDIKPSNPAFRHEFFGPVAMMFRVKNDEEAVALANDSDFGLGGSVFTKDIERGKRIASRVDTGMMFINNLDWSDAELPFGGIKNSGYGRELGELGIQQFINKKMVRTGHFDVPA